MRKDDGTWIEDHDGLCNMVSSYFGDLFISSSPSGYGDTVDCIDKTLSEIDIDKIGKPVSEYEVYDAVMQMHPSKAPGPDGMTALFYQKFWNIVGPTVVNVVSQFFNSGINATKSE